MCLQADPRTVDPRLLRARDPGSTCRKPRTARCGVAGCSQDLLRDEADGLADLDLLLVGQVIVWRPGLGRPRSLAVRVQGQREPDEAGSPDVVFGGIGVQPDLVLTENSPQDSTIVAQGILGPRAALERVLAAARDVVVPELHDHRGPPALAGFQLA